MSMTDLGRLSVDEIRAERARLQAQEDAVSFVRRLAQGRLDLARDEEHRSDHQLLRELEALCVEVGFGSLRELDDVELATCCQRVAEFESQVSTLRKQLFADIDSLSKELVRRYRTSTSSVDALLDGR